MKPYKNLTNLVEDIPIDKGILHTEKLIELDKHSISELERYVIKYQKNLVKLSESKEAKDEGYSGRDLIVGGIESCILTPIYAYVSLPWVIPTGLGILVYKTTKSSFLTELSVLGSYLGGFMCATQLDSPKLSEIAVFSYILNMFATAGVVPVLLFGAQELLLGMGLDKPYKKIINSYHVLTSNIRENKKEKLENEIKLYLHEKKLIKSKAF